MDLLQSTAQTVTVQPRQRLDGPSGTWLDRSGEATPLTVTIDPVSASVASATQAAVVLDDASGVVVGRRYLVREAGQPDRYAIAESVSGSTVTWAEPLDRAPTAGASVLGVAVECAVLASHTADRGAGYRIRIVSGAAEHVEWVTVVRHLFDDPATPEDAREYIARIAPSSALGPSWYASMAGRACELVRRQLDVGGLRPDLFGDSSAFREAGRLALSYVIARDDGIYPPHTQDTDAWLRDRDGMWRDAVSDAVSSLSSYDASDSGGIDDETDRRASMISLRRSA